MSRYLPAQWTNLGESMISWYSFKQTKSQVIILSLQLCTWANLPHAGISQFLCPPEKKRKKNNFVMEKIKTPVQILRLFRCQLRNANYSTLHTHPWYIIHSNQTYCMYALTPRGLPARGSGAEMVLCGQLHWFAQRIRSCSTLSGVVASYAHTGNAHNHLLFGKFPHPF